jgi:protein TonB
MKANFDPAFRSESIAMIERSSYKRSKGNDPVATLAALGLVAATVGAVMFASPAFIHKQKHDTVVVNLLEMPKEPPPAEQPDPQPQPEAVTPPQTPIVSPPPEVVLPTMPSPVMAAPQPAPPAPSAPAKAGPTAMTASTTSAGPANGGELSSRVLFAKPPRYPVDSRRQHEEGTVVLSILLSIDGNVSDIGIARSSGSPRLDRAALDAVKNWRWQPLIRDGAAVMVRGIVTIPFVLQRGGGDHRGGHHGRDEEGRGHEGPGRDGPGGRDRDRDGDFPTT